MKTFLFFKVNGFKDLFYSLSIILATSITYIYTAEKILHADSILALNQKALALFITLVIFTYLIYLAVQDIKTMEIPYGITIKILGGLAAINIVGILLFESQATIELWEGNFYTPVNNLIGAAIAGGAIALIVYFTKEKAMGEGDIYIAALMGLILGSSKLIAGLYITIISAMIFSILYALKIKKFRNVRIPFIPFLVFGTITAFLLWPEISQIIANLLYVG